VIVDAPPFGSTYAKGSASITLKAHFTDPDNGPWTYTSNWDDGTANGTGSLTTSGQSFQANHSFPNTGVYTINGTSRVATHTGALVWPALGITAPGTCAGPFGAWSHPPA